MLRKALPFLCALLLASCGGGDDYSPPPPPAPPTGLSYSAPPAFTVGSAITALTPNVTGAVISYSVAPALPAGLSISNSTGVISGTPTANAPAANYVVTAGNAGGTTTASVSITVNDPPPVISYANTPYVLTMGTAATITPTVTGVAPASWSVDRALPAGLTISATTGVISGTPSAIGASANYVVTATSPGGNSTATLALAVNASPPVIAYFGSSFALPTGVPFNLVPSSTGGAVVNWSVNPALPAGLAINGATGAISGTPTQVSPSVTHVVSAQNTGGTTDFNIAISVVAPATDNVLLDLGHSSGGFVILHDGVRILSGGPHGTEVVLWNAQTGENLANTKIRCTAVITCLNSARGTALHGPVAVIKQPEGFDVRSSVDGSALALIAWREDSRGWWTLATDGSYIAGGNESRLTVWSPTGAILFVRAGDFRNAKAFAAPGELRLIGGPSGASVVEYLALPVGTSTLSPAFQGVAHSWFLEGESFLTNSGNTTWVYSKLAVQRDTATLPSIEGLEGQGEWVWTRSTSPATLRLYRVGAGSTPAATYTAGASGAIWPSKGAIAFAAYGDAQISVVDLSGSAPVKQDYVTPLPYLEGFGSASSTDWAFINTRGAMFGELGGSSAPMRYALGRVESIAGSASRIAVATADSIHYFSAATLQPQGEIDFASDEVQLSADGSVLAAAADRSYVQYRPDQSLKIFSLPSESLLAEWPHSYPNDLLWDFTLSLSGDVVGQVTGAIAAPSTASVTLLDGTAIWTGTTGVGLDARPIHLSPNGQWLAVADGTSSASGTNIYLNGSHTNLLEGIALSWVDDNQILLNRRGPSGYLGVDHRTAGGQVVTALLPLPELSSIQVIPPSSLYSSERNTVYSLSTGGVLWSGPASVSAGAVAGSNVIYALGASVIAEPL